MSEWMSEWASEWVSKWVSEWMNDQMSEWMSEWAIHSTTQEGVEEWVNESMEKQIYGEDYQYWSCFAGDEITYTLTLRNSYGKVVLQPSKQTQIDVVMEKVSRYCGNCGACGACGTVVANLFSNKKSRTLG